MSFLILIVGVAVLATVFLEMLWTTMGIGSGLITRYISGSLWRILMKLHRFRPSHVLLTWGGIMILLFVFTSWVFMLWMGWSLIFLSSDTAVIHVYTGDPASFWDQIYFTGFTISTLGIGDFAPQGYVWQFLTALASLSGLFFVTFSVTYLVPIVSAVTSARKTSVYISSLGLNPHQIIKHNCKDGSCNELERHLNKISSDLLELEQQHLTYPILHYFHIPLQPESVILSIAKLDEALTILIYAMPDDENERSSTIRVARQSITEFLDTISETFVRVSSEAPPPPDLEPLRNRFPASLDREDFEKAIEHLSRRRRILRGLVETEGWVWDDVYNQDGDLTGEYPLNQSESIVQPGEAAT